MMQRCCSAFQHQLQKFGKVAAVSSPLLTATTTGNNNTMLCCRGLKYNDISCRNASSSSEKLYEFRCYKMRPGNIKKAMEYAAECLPIRFSHSPCLGYWAADVGGLGEVVHIWEYENYNGRAAIRKALNADPGWIAKAKPMIDQFEEMTSTTMRAFSWSEIKKQTAPGGVYFVYKFTFKPSTSESVMSDALESFVNNSGCDVLGAWREELGKCSLLNAYMLFHAPHYDSEKNPAQLSADKWRQLREVTSEVHGRLLAPQPWSAMQ